jgi:PAS domain S-box-containing protein
VKQITLKTKLVCGFLGVGLITIVVGYEGLIGMEQTGKVLSEISIEHLPSIISLAKINRDLYEIRILERGMVMENDPDLRQEYLLKLNHHWHVTEADWANYGVLRKAPKETQLWQELVSLRKSWRKLNQEAAQLVSKGDERSLKLARNLVDLEGSNRFDQCLFHLLALYDLNEQSMMFYQKKSVATLYLAQRLALGGTIIGVALVLILGLLVGRSIQDAHEKLLASEEWLATTLRSIGDAVITTDPQGRVTFMNPLAQSLTGWMVEDAMGKSLAEIFTIISEDTGETPKDPGSRLIPRSVEGRSPNYGILVGKDGRQTSIIISSAPITNTQGVTIGTILVFHDITELRRSEEQIAYQAQLLSNVNDPVVAATPDFFITYWNRAATRLYGWEEKEVIGKKVDEVVQVSLANTSRVKLREEVLRTGKWRGEALHYNRNHAEIMVDWSISTIQDVHGQVIGMVSITRDITAEKKAEQALKESEQQYRMLVKTLPAVVFRGYADWRVDFFDEKIEELTGYSKEVFDSRSMKWIDLILEEDLEEVNRAFRQALTGTKSYIREYQIKHRDGRILWIQARAQIICDADGKVAYVSGVFFDITQQKQVQEAIKASEARNRLLIEKSPVGIGINTLDLQVYTNAALVKTFGYDHADEIVGQPVTRLYAPEDRERVESWHRDILAGKPVQANYEGIGLRKDGTTFDISLWPALIDYQGQPAVLNFVIDVSQEKVLRAKLLQSQKMEAMGTLAGGIAHDFNNILGVMRGYTEMTLSGVAGDSDLERKLNQVLKAGQRAKDLVSQILAFSRPGKQERKDVRISSVINEALKMLRATLPATIEIRQDIATQEGRVLADPTEIHQVLINLGANAAHAMREKGGVLTVSLASVSIDAMAAAKTDQLSPGPYVTFTVRDTGQGMDREVMKRIYDPFFTTKKPGEGTGMGLAVVHGIIKAHGGAIHVDSQPGKGSAVHVYLPRVEKGAAAKTTKKVSLTGGTERILFVDDEESLVEMWQEVLEGLGYKVIGKTSSSDALACFKEQPDHFDLVITDQTMVHMTGFRLAKKLLQIHPTIPIILCTGFSDTITSEQAKAAGIREYLMKPLSIPDLSAAIRRVVKAGDQGDQA